MDEINFQTKAPQAGAEEQLINGKSVVDQNISFVASILTIVGDKLPKKSKYLISYHAAKATGLIVVFLKGNRKVYNTQIENLWKSAKNSKMFEEACHVVPLRPILEEFPEIEAYNINGARVTLDNPNVDYCLAVYDGQHRITACELHPEIDVLLELNDFNGTHPLTSIKLMNSYSRNWNCSDLRFSNVCSGRTKNQLYEEAEKLHYLYGISIKMAEYILTFEREATRKKDLIDGKDTTLYNEKKADRGIGIYNAAMANFKGVKELKKIEIIDAIVTAYKNVDDDKKGDFAIDMKVFIGSMEKSLRDNVIRFITEKDFGNLKSYICNEFKIFCDNKHTKDLSSMEDNVDKLVSDYVQNLKSDHDKKSKTRRLKSGRVSDIVKAQKELISNPKETECSQGAVDNV